MNYSIFKKNAEGETETQGVDEWAYRQWLSDNAPKELSQDKKVLWVEHQMHVAKMNMQKTQTFKL